MANNRVRFANNNQVSGLASANITYSSQLTNFPFTNSQSDARYRVWKPGGNFTVDSTNKNIYINDGADKTVTLTEADYTYSTLATHIQTQLNASSSGWTCTYSTTTNKFTIGNSGSVTLRETQTTNASWDMLGYTNGTDHAGTSFEADETRIHTHESVVWDLGSAQAGDFFAVIGQAGETFTISSTATITIKANSVNDFSSPPVSETLTRTDDGIFAYLDGTASPSYRYWEFKWIDRQNSLGPEGFNIGHMYLGDYDTLTTTNVATGFTKTLVDPTTVMTSDAGSKFFRTRSKFWKFGGMQIQNLTESERETLETFFASFGVASTFYISLDPNLSYTSAINHLTKYCRFVREPAFANIIRDIYSMDLEIEEVV